MSGVCSLDQPLPASNYTDGQRLAAMEDVRRIMKEEVRMDWIELWEERWRKRLEKLQSKAARRGKSKDGAAETGIAIQRSREDGGEENVDDGGDEGDDGGDDDDEGEWDGAGAGWDADRKDGEDVWVHRSDDSDFLKAADTYPPPGSLPRSLPLAQKNNVLGSPTRGGGGEGWTASVTRLMGGMGFGSSPLQPEQINATSSPTTPLSTAGASSTTGSPHPLAAAAVANPYRFASPDSITPSLAALREKRREELERQMDLSDPEGNVGLRCWIERRDAWTGANEEGCVRVGRSKFAENPLTASVNEAAYSAIYSKCIKKALPPVVPINLRHITNAMVAGWKKDNEWPPALAPSEPSFSKRRPVRGPGRGGPGASSPAVDGGVGARRVLGML